jgi:probable HAF family extracellular repeat protein
MVDLGPTYTPLLINNAGVVVAYAGPPNSGGTYISSGGTGAWINMGSLGGAETVPYGINNGGEIVGLSTTGASGTGHAFLFSGRTMTNLGTFGGDTSAAQGINDYGLVVGEASLPNDTGTDAFIYYGSGSIVDLNSLVDPTLGWTIEGAVAINDSGQIVALGQQQGGPYRALLLTPVPEPKSVVLLLFAGCAVLVCKLGVHFGSISKLNYAVANRKSYD